MLAQESAGNPPLGCASTQPRLPHLQPQRGLGRGEQHRRRLDRSRADGGPINTDLVIGGSMIELVTQQAGRRI